MKKLGIIITMLLLSFTGISQEKKGITITITIENVLSNEGTIVASLHTKDTFMKGPGIMSVNAPAKEGEVSLTFENIQPGTFGIIILHDANDNKQMDRELNGMPKENYATSGATTFGPPNFNVAKFDVADENIEFRIRF